MLNVPVGFDAANGSAAEASVAVTNLAALRLQGLPPLLRVTAAVGLVACLVLASQVDTRSMVLGLAVLIAGLVGRAAVRLIRPSG